MNAVARLVLLSLAVCASGCDMLDMYDERRFEPLEASDFFEDGASARPLVAGTVARGDLRADEAFYTGRSDGKYVATLPLDLDRDELRDFLKRGQQRFHIYCSPCHGRDGDGRGMIVERGFTRPPSFVRLDRLRNAPLGHFYDVISNGFGAMPSYASRIEPRDRWAIAAYIRALQRSQNASLDDVPEEERGNIIDSTAVEADERGKRGAAERRDLDEKELQRDIEKHQRSPEEGERRHRELQEKSEDSTGNQGGRSREAASFDSPGWSAAEPWVNGRIEIVSPNGAAFPRTRQRWHRRGGADHRNNALSGLQRFASARNPGLHPGLSNDAPSVLQRPSVILPNSLPLGIPAKAGYQPIRDIRRHELKLAANAIANEHGGAA